jgi:hypothetical protein
MKFLLINPPMDYEILKKEFSFEAYLPPLEDLSVEIS